MERKGNRKAVKKEYRISARITKKEKELLEKETLDEEEFVAIMKRVEEARQPHDV